jgi:malate dehydrogenase (oxaloacetate-decarboxylating)
LKEHTDLRPAQQSYARDRSELSDWNISNNINLLDVISKVKPTILIGTSAQAGAFDEMVIRTMAKHVEIPIVLPLSNPNNRVEATPQDLIDWTDGKIMLATGSPFEPVKFKNEERIIAQCNNAKVFPGIGLGVIVAKPRLMSKGMLLAAAYELSQHAPVLTEGLHAPLLPSIAISVEASKRIAYSVANQAVKEGLSELALDKLEASIEEKFWKPEYLPYYKTGTRHC